MTPPPAASSVAGIDAIDKEVKDIRASAQHEMLLDEHSDPEKVISYLVNLKEMVDAQQKEAKRINKYQVWLLLRRREEMG